MHGAEIEDAKSHDNYRFTMVRLERKPTFRRVFLLKYYKNITILSHQCGNQLWDRHFL